MLNGEGQIIDFVSLRDGENFPEASQVLFYKVLRCLGGRWIGWLRFNGREKSEL